MAEIDDILQLLKSFDRRLRSLETTPQPPNINSIASSQTSFTLHAASADWVSVRINNTDNYKLLAVPSLVIYKDSVSAANRWPDGANWSTFLGSFQFFPWLDYSLSDGNDQQFRILFINFDTRDINLIFQVGFRYLLKGVEA